MNAYQIDNGWKSLLAQSAPTFYGETSVPYGFATRVLSQLREDRCQQNEAIRIGRRALLAALSALGLTVAVTLTLDAKTRFSFDPGVRNLVQLDKLPYS